MQPSENQAPTTGGTMPYYEDREREEPWLFKKLRGHLPRLAGARRVLEPGCGRGEFLHLLRQQGIAGLGVDLSPENVRLARAQGLEVAQADALAHLAGLPDASFDGFFCSNLVEHLDLAKLEALLDQAARLLSPGGRVLLATANPECLGVMAGAFWNDPTHVRPYPPAALAGLLQARGFAVLEAGPDENSRGSGPLRSLVRALRTRLVGPHFGPPEIYVLARKP
jgi:O-antigen chain-terminating methyltransferase